jgi:hypothetical protein
VDTKPFHPDTYLGPEHEDEDLQGDNIREKSMTVKLRVENTLRWRWTKDENGQDVRRSHVVSRKCLFNLDPITETRIKRANHPLVRRNPEPSFRQRIVRHHSVYRFLWPRLTFDLGRVSVSTISKHTELSTKW